MSPRVRDRLSFAAARAALLAVNLLPELPAYALFGAAGRLYFRCSKRRQRLALRMLRNAYGAGPSERELMRIARVATGNIFKVALDTVRVIPWIRRGRLEERLDVGAFRRGAPPKPFLAVTAHLGSWEIGGIAVSIACGESHAIARVFRNPLLQRFILANRQRAGLHIHPKRGGVRDLARALRDGHVGMQVVDQHQRLRGVRVPFFGEMASNERSAAVLALRQGYPIAVGGAARVGGGFRFVTFVEGTIRAEPTSDHQADVVRVTREINALLERMILRYPEQYMWIHRRYR